MQILHFKCKHQVLTMDCAGRLVVADSKQQVYANFALDEEWNGLTVMAIFTPAFSSNGYEVLIKENLIEVPPEVLSAPGFRVSLHGIGNNGEKHLPTAFMEKPVSVTCAGALVGIAPETITPDIWEQVLSAIGNLSNLDTKDKSNLVAAINETLRHVGDTNVTSGELCLSDLTTGKKYKLYVDAGRLTMVDVAESSQSNDSVTLTDVTNGDKYILYVDSGKLTMAKESEA